MKKKTIILNEDKIKFNIKKGEQIFKNKNSKIF